MNVDIFAQLAFGGIYECTNFPHLAILFKIQQFIFSLTSYFRASNTLREMREMCENMYCVKIATFTVNILYDIHSG